MFFFNRSLKKTFLFAFTVHIYILKAMEVNNISDIDKARRVFQLKIQLCTNINKCMFILFFYHNTCKDE